MGEKNDYQYYLTEFASLKKKENENVEEFTKRLNKLYNKIPTSIKPTPTAAMINFSGAFEPYFAVLLRERRSRTLLRMQSDAVALEGNLTAAGNLARIDPDKKGKDVEKINQKDKGNKLGKEEPSSSNLAKNSAEIRME
jgi:hypothetical protein